MIAAQTYDIIFHYHDGVISVSKWFLVIVLGCILSIIAYK